MKAYSDDIRIRIIRAYERKEGSQRGLAARFNVSLSFVRDLLKQFRETGSIAPKPRGGGQLPKIDADGLQLIRGLLEEAPRATLEELCALYAARRGFRPSAATMHRALRKLGRGRPRGDAAKGTARP